MRPPGAEWDENRLLIPDSLKQNSVRNRVISRFTAKTDEKCPKSAIFAFGTGENRDESKFRAKQPTISDLYRKH